MAGVALRGHGSWKRPRLLKIRDVSLYVQVVGHGYPLVLMHGGPSADLFTLLPFRQLADRFTLVFYDHRCNGRSAGAPVSSMTWENLTADAEALRQKLGFDRWAVLGHSFGGQVALEYALRYPGSLSHLVLLDAGGDSRWSQQNAADLLARRGYSRKKAELVRRWFNGEFAPREYFPIFMRIGGAYFVFPPEHQGQLAAGIPGARLHIVERAGHEPHSERPAEVMAVITDFISADAPLT